MATNQLDLIMNQVLQLSASEQLQLIKRVAESLGRAEQPQRSARAASLRDFTADRQWLADHRDEYAGQWVALKFGRLVSYGKNAKEVHRAAQDAGHQDALLVLVETSDAPPFIL
jgi:hypothetical protein